MMQRSMDEEAQASPSAHSADDDGDRQIPANNPPHNHQHDDDDAEPHADSSTTSTQKTPREIFDENYARARQEREQNSQERRCIQLLHRLTSSNDPSIATIMDDLDSFGALTELSNLLAVRGNFDVLMVAATVWCYCTQSKLIQALRKDKNLKWCQRPIMQHHSGKGATFYLVYATYQDPKEKKPNDRKTRGADKPNLSTKCRENALDHQALAMDVHNKCIKRAFGKYGKSSDHNLLSYNPANKKARAQLNELEWHERSCKDFDKYLREVGADYSLGWIGIGCWQHDERRHFRTVYKDDCYTNEARPEAVVLELMRDVGINLAFDFEKAVKDAKDAKKDVPYVMELHVGWEIKPKFGFGYLSHKISKPWKVTLYEKGMFLNLGAWASAKFGKFDGLPDFITFIQLYLPLCHTFSGNNIILLVFYVAMRALQHPSVENSKWPFLKQFATDMESAIESIIHCCNTYHSGFKIRGESVVLATKKTELVQGVCRDAVTGAHKLDKMLDQLLRLQVIQVLGNVDAHIENVMFEHVKVLADIATTDWRSTTVDMKLLSRIHHAVMALLFFTNGQTELRSPDTEMRFGYLLANEKIDITKSGPKSVVNWNGNVDDVGQVLLKPDILDMPMEELVWLQTHVPIRGTLTAAAPFPKHLYTIMDIVLYTLFNDTLHLPMDLEVEAYVTKLKEHILKLLCRGVRSNSNTAKNWKAVQIKSAFKKKSILRHQCDRNRGKKKLGSVTAAEIADRVIQPQSALGCIFRCCLPNGADIDEVLQPALLDFVKKYFDLFPISSLDNSESNHSFFWVKKNKAALMDAAEKCIKAGAARDDIPGDLRRDTLLRMNNRKENVEEAPEEKKIGKCLEVFVKRPRQSSSSTTSGEPSRKRRRIEKRAPKLPKIECRWDGDGQANYNGEEDDDSEGDDESSIASEEEDEDAVDRISENEEAENQSEEEEGEYLQQSKKNDDEDANNGEAGSERVEGSDFEIIDDENVEVDVTKNTDDEDEEVDVTTITDDEDDQGVKANEDTKSNPMTPRGTHRINTSPSSSEDTDDDSVICLEDSPQIKNVFEISDDSSSASATPQRDDQVKDITEELQKSLNVSYKSDVMEIDESPPLDAQYIPKDIESSPPPPPPPPPQDAEMEVEQSPPGAQLPLNNKNIESSPPPPPPPQDAEMEVEQSPPGAQLPLNNVGSPQPRLLPMEFDKMASPQFNFKSKEKKKKIRAVRVPEKPAPTTMIERSSKVNKLKCRVALGDPGQLLSSSEDESEWTYYPAETVSSYSDKIAHRGCKIIGTTRDLHLEIDKTQTRKQHAVEANKSSRGQNTSAARKESLSSLPDDSEVNVLGLLVKVSSLKEAIAKPFLKKGETINKKWGDREKKLLAEAYVGTDALMRIVSDLTQGGRTLTYAELRTLFLRLNGIERTSQSVTTNLTRLRRLSVQRLMDMKIDKETAEATSNKKEEKKKKKTDNRKNK